MEESTIHSKIHNFLSAIVVIGFATVILQILVWNYEEDPLTVTQAGDGLSLADDGSFTFKRRVQSDADLQITIKSFWHNTDGSMNTDGVRGEFVEKETTVYNLNAGFVKVMTFNRFVPKVEDLKPGRYEYIPVAQYQINPIKTIVKELPIQIVDIK